MFEKPAADHNAVMVTLVVTSIMEIWMWDMLGKVRRLSQCQPAAYLCIQDALYPLVRSLKSYVHG